MPHLLSLLQEERSGAGAGARALAPLLLVGLSERDAPPGLADARQALVQTLKARSGVLTAASCAVAEAALEVVGRAPWDGAALPELDAATEWWDSLPPVLQSAAPARLQRALRSAGLLAAAAG